MILASGGYMQVFLSTPSVRRATPAGLRNGCSFAFLSTPSVRRATVPVPATMVICNVFLSTPSVRRATAGVVWRAAASLYNFYPRPPCGGRPICLPISITAFRISIHALRAEGDEELHDGVNQTGNISIHALRAEGDAEPFAVVIQQLISIHALRAEGDPAEGRPVHRPHDFYPRPPCGGRRRDER